MLPRFSRNVSISSLNPTKHPPPLPSEVVLKYLSRCSRGMHLAVLGLFGMSRRQLRPIELPTSPRLLALTKLTIIFPQRHQELRSRETFLRGRLLQARSATFLPPISLRRPLRQLFQHWRWQDLPGRPRLRRELPLPGLTTPTRSGIR